MPARGAAERMRWTIIIEAHDGEGKPSAFPALDVVEGGSEPEASAGLFARLSHAGARPLPLRVRPEADGEVPIPSPPRDASCRQPGLDSRRIRAFSR